MHQDDSDPHDIYRLMADLDPRVCACGDPTGSPGLDQCARCEGRERARRVIERLHAEATR